VLGYLNPDSLAGGSMKIERGLSADAILEHVARPANLTLNEAAYGIHAVAISNMVRAIKTVSVERGRDPREFVLMAFGGAGPLHAAEVARALRIGRVLIPEGPGVFSAAGLLAAEIELHSSRTVLAYERDVDETVLGGALSEMRRDLVQRLRDEGFHERDVITHASVDICYKGQSSELTVPLPDGGVTASSIEAAYEAFEAEYERTYGHRGRNRRFEIVNVRMVATAPRLSEDAGMRRMESGAASAYAARDAYFGAQWGLLQTRVVGRAALSPQPVAGPLIIQEYDSTVVVPPDCTAARDDYGSIVIEVPCEIV
jgi:N-methylhydantoinase A